MRECELSVIWRLESRDGGTEGKLTAFKGFFGICGLSEEALRVEGAIERDDKAW